jgi:hypothetical protein
MKFLILTAGLSAALGFTYSAFTAGRYAPTQFDASCLKVCGAGPVREISRRSCNGGPLACNVTNCT